MQRCVTVAWARNFDKPTLLKTDELNFDLPEKLIAQEPLLDRGQSQLLHYRRSDRSISHRIFSDLPQLLRAGDLLVFNDAHVIPARFALRKKSSGRIGGLFLSEPRPGFWRCLLRNLGKAEAGMELEFESEPALKAIIRENLGGGEFKFQISSSESATIILDRLGRMPLPPYIHRQTGRDDRDELDRQRYQTVYAKSPGAVAAPTAGLHFTSEILDALDAIGVMRTTITLHVGIGTFRPISTETLESHLMHEEFYEISESAAEKLNDAKRNGRRIIAVGTTSARVLESQPVGTPFFAKKAATSIFIYPPYQWKHVDALITNFHLPRSTLIALVAAKTGLEEQRRIYREAIQREYRFFSYGDAMLIE